MSDIMRPIPFNALMTWILDEYRAHGTIFGQRRIVRCDPQAARPIFDEKIETPFGPAAGPNTQLAQNIVASYVTGARFFELKTVQQMDGAELSACVNKPCILAADEGYNCEWSTELYVPQAFEEYVKGWVACKLLSRELELGGPDGFVFNMSVGYDLEGIKGKKVDRYITDMMDASATPIFQECIGWAKDNLDLFERVDEAFVDSISPRISNSITESTLHGCPPDEIERIASYLITEKGLNTYIKCNPTLLGYEFARKTMDDLGYGYVSFDDHHFLEDLQWEDAVPMFKRLQALCAERGVEFGVKLTNTFPVDVKAGELPSEEMYMSGRAEFPLSINLSRRVSKQFDGALRISYSGGADAFNIRSLVDAGVWPVTMATNVLRPGGYDRFAQIAELLAGIDNAAFGGVDVPALEAIADDALSGSRYRHGTKPLPNRHISSALALFDCFTAPCSETCPIHQDIPGYLKAVEEGRYEEALSIVLERNALPFTTGTLCPHTCGNSCMRNYYEDHVHIRAFKLEAAQKGYNAIIGTLAPRATRDDVNVAVVGAGPAGLATASFLSRAGARVTVFERTEAAGGIVRHAIPTFRIADESIDSDVVLCSAYGATFEYGRDVRDVRELFAEGFTDVVVAVGAWAPGTQVLRSGAELDAVDFLAQVKNAPGAIDLGTDVVVVGGGNTAMDVARQAKRQPGVENVRVVYRRTKRYMPADEEELVDALADGVELLELLAPLDFDGAQLVCERMALGEADESGRLGVVGTGEEVRIAATAVIGAVGERIEGALFEASGIEMDGRGRPVVDDAYQTSVSHVYVAGDCRRGPSTVVWGIADAAHVASAIANVDFTGMAARNIMPTVDGPLAKHGVMNADTTSLAQSRCLGCPTVCEACAEVCPNRANVAVRVPGMTQEQIVHVDGMCNECGNCAVFCPYAEGRPYKDKLTVFWSEEDFADSQNQGFLAVEGGFKVRLSGIEQVVDVDSADCGLPAEVQATIQAVRDNYAYLLG